MRHIAHYHNRKTSLPIHAAHKITVFNVGRKSENPRFEICNFVVAPSGGAEKNLNMGAQLHIIPYKKPKKIFFRIARLNKLSVRTNVGPIVRFWHYRYKLTVFVAPCNDVGKYFYTGAHLQYMGYKAVVVVFFQVTSRWSKWCAQTLHPILLF